MIGYIPLDHFLLFLLLNEDGERREPRDCAHRADSPFEHVDIASTEATGGGSGGAVCDGILDRAGGDADRGRGLRAGVIADRLRTAS